MTRRKAPAQPGMRSMADMKPAKPRPADEPAPATNAEVYAIQAMIAGTATEHQQKIGMQWIITAAAGTPQYYASERDTTFALGRAFVAQQIIGIARISLVNIAQPTQQGD
jgi:hypothetical protein